VVKTLGSTLAKGTTRVAAGWPIQRVLVVQFLRSARSWLPFDLSRNTKPTTGQAIATYCKSQNLVCESKQVGTESSKTPCLLHFIELGSSSHEGKILFYFHGGAYVNPIDTKGQLPFTVDSAKAAKVSKLVILEYTLAPELKYPGQLIQAVEALEDILQTYDPSRIILGGDSAGGNLLLALFAHIKQPNPRAKTLKIDTPFAAAYLISPWVKPSPEAKSFASYSRYDYINAEMVTAWTKMWSPVLSEVWADASRGGSELWQDFPAKTLLITVGGWECFLDDVEILGKQLGASVPSGGSPRVEFFVGEKEVHVQCAVDKAVGLPYGHTASKILSWLGSRAEEETVTPA
jgi:acetyl esterase/lipase